MLQVLSPLLEDLRNDSSIISKSCDFISFLVDVPFVNPLFPFYPSLKPESDDLSLYFSSIDSSSLANTLALEDWE